jgi:hypothetical protein
MQLQKIIFSVMMKIFLLSENIQFGSANWSLWPPNHQDHQVSSSTMATTIWNWWYDWTEYYGVSVVAWGYPPKASLSILGSRSIHIPLTSWIVQVVRCDLFAISEYTWAMGAKTWCYNFIHKLKIHIPRRLRLVGGRHVWLHLHMQTIVEIWIK